jgi:hypothetical protein
MSEAVVEKSMMAFLVKNFEVQNAGFAFFF